MRLKKIVCFFAVLLCFASLAAFSAKAQTEQEIVEDTKNLVVLYKQQKFTEALPYAEKLVKVLPDSAELQFIYGFCLLGQSKNTKNTETAEQLAVKARQAFVKSKELGKEDELLDALIGSLSTDGTERGRFSANSAAESAMKEAEGLFSQGKFDQALTEYKKALDADPKIYEAALFSGDCYTQKGDFANAEIWYQKAIAINPDRETAWRYSATPLMKQEKYDLARDRYIEAFIVEPYNRFAPIGLTNWGKVTQTALGHPKIDVPEIKYDANGKATTVMNGNSLTESSAAWLAYSLARENWKKEKFAKAFPNEKQYRHSLQEETEALRGVVKMFKEKKSANPDKQLEILAKLDEEDLIEPYILLAIPDNGIAQDHAAYLKTNRDNLRKYVLKYVIISK